MKKLISIFTIALLFLIQSLNVSAECYKSYRIPLFKVSETETEVEPLIRPGSKGHRTPTRPIPCTVSESGIEFAIGTDDITGYELWDADGEICLGVYSDDIDAANHIFTIPGEYQLVIETQESSYVGFISTL